MFNILSNSCQMNVFDIFCKKLQSEERNLRESSISADCHFRGVPFPGMEIAQKWKMVVRVVFIFGWERGCGVRSVDNVTQLGKILPLWHNFDSLLKCFEGLIYSVWDKNLTTFGKCFCCRVNFYCCKWPDIDQWSNHLVTLLVPILMLCCVCPKFFSRFTLYCVGGRKAKI